MAAFELPHSRDYIMQRMGDLSQIGGVKRYVLSEGRSAGVEAIDIETGSGLCFTVLPGRGMDIAWAKYKGVPLSYISKTGVAHSAYYDPRGMNWLKGFFAGLLTTCGLTNAGNPSSDHHFLVGDLEHGLHGRISNTPAYAVSAYHEWEGDTCRIKASGTMRESFFHMENVTMKRVFDTFLGAKSFTLTDTITNEGFVTHPLMLLYHINVGYPMIGENSRFAVASKSVKQAPGCIERRNGGYATFDPPAAMTRETSYAHELMTDDDGMTEMAVINDAIGLALSLKYSPADLRCFNQWKQMSCAEYVMGLEPGTVFPLGLEDAKKTGNIEYLEPGQTKTITIEFGVSEGMEDIEALTGRIASLAY